MIKLAKEITKGKRVKHLVPWLTKSQSPLQVSPGPWGEELGEGPWPQLLPEDDAHAGSNAGGMAGGASQQTYPRVTPFLGTKKTLLEYIKGYFQGVYLLVNLVSLYI